MKPILAGFLYVAAVLSTGIGAGRLVMGAVDGLAFVALGFVCVIWAGRWI